jgi:signal transduction histidine kinase
MSHALAAPAALLHPDPSRRALLAAGSAAALVAVGISAAVAATGTEGDPWLVASLRGVITGVPLGVGLYAWYRRVHMRFGLLLVAAGAAWFVTTLAESQDPLVSTIGRIGGWFVWIAFIALVLAFPTGRLSGRTDRLLVGAMTAVVLTLFLPRLFLAETFDVPAPFTSCVEDCPRNAVFALDAEPGIVAAFLRPFGALAVFLVTTATVVHMHRRRAQASPHTRRILTPVLGVAIAFVGLLGVAIVARQVDRSAQALETAAFLLALAMPAVSVAFLVGLVRWRLFAGRALERLALRLHGAPDRAALRRAFADALDDASLDLAFPPAEPSASWTDCAGRPTTLPVSSPDRAVTEVRNEGRLIAAISHDPALTADPELLGASTAMVGVILDNQRLTDEARSAVRDMRRSRARIAASAEQERRRIERDLHDGAQQRLVALRIELGLAEDLVRRDPDEAASLLQDLEHEVDETLEELRALAHGVYPPLLADRGLTEALRAAASRVRLKVVVDARDVGRYPPEIESAVYFCALEALQNVLKHAPDAHRVDIRMQGGRERLRFSVRDDGGGAAGGELRPGFGITNMQDRVAAVGGDVQVVSTPRVGTLVRGSVPTQAPR